MLSQSVLNNLPFPVLGFAARSGTGKTTLLLKLIPELKSRGLRLGLIKHTHHRITFDNRGLTKRVFEQGFDVIATSPEISMAEWHQENPETALLDGIETYRHLPIDLLLIEGFKQVPLPKIELHRQSLNAPLLCEADTAIVALASDVSEELLNLPRPLAVLNFNDVTAISDWIMENVMENSLK